MIHVVGIFSLPFENETFNKWQFFRWFSLLAWFDVLEGLIFIRIESQITGGATVVKKALYQVVSCLHDNPSRSQHSLLSVLDIYRSGIAFNNQDAGGPLVGTSSLMGPYCNYKNNCADWSSVVKEFSIRIICPTEKIGAAIGKGGAIIKQIRQESGAVIVVDSSGADGDDCVIYVSSKEVKRYLHYSAHMVTLNLQCSEFAGDVLDI